MTAALQYQVRFDLAEAARAEALRRGQTEPALVPLVAALARHHAVAKCQYDAFAEYVAAAEQHGVDQFPLYAWTKATIENPVKKEKYLKSFSLHVEGQEIYDKAAADALEAELKPLAEAGVVSRLKKYDTDPAHNPQPPQPG
ncbi:MAG TPA: hypothetical protein VFE63_17710 [Roseiarcus sp.]|jgi:hypothetical protein|nr:hypothetical protein [Roseiarcus sp.]